jgi:hypothetical protein
MSSKLICASAFAAALSIPAEFEVVEGAPADHGPWPIHNGLECVSGVLLKAPFDRSSLPRHGDNDASVRTVSRGS